MQGEGGSRRGRDAGRRRAREAASVSAKKKKVREKRTDASLEVPVDDGRVRLLRASSTSTRRYVPSS